MHYRKLLSFQISHVKSLLASINQNGVVLDASDTGTGKTYSALALAKQLNLTPIVVCPKSIIPGWIRAIKYFEFDDYFVSNYEKFRVGSTPYLDKIGINPEYQDFRETERGQKKPNKSWERHQYDQAEKEFRENSSKIPKLEYLWQLDSNKHLLIFDECHKTKNTNTQNYAIYWWAQQLHQKTGLKILSLSATVADKIVNAYSICYMLKLAESGHDFNLKYNLNLDQGMLKDFGCEVTSAGFYKFNPEYRSEYDRFQNEDCNLKKLHEDLFPIRGSRMIIEDLGDQFPDNFVSAQAYDMDHKAKQIQKIYQEMEQSIAHIKYLQAQQQQEELLELERKAIEHQDMLPREIRRMNSLRKSQDNNLEKIDQLRNKLESYGQKITWDHLNNKSFDDEKQHILTIRQKARQRVELLKADTLVEQGIEFLEGGKSVVIFVNFIETLEYLLEKFSIKINNIIKNLSENNQSKNSGSKNKRNQSKNHQFEVPISIIRGGQSIRERQNNLDAFQNNQHRLILMTMQSGRESISLHDTQGNHPRVSLISPSWSAQDLVQALGRIHRAEGKSPCLQYLVYCANTIEDRVCEVVQRKIETINLINDGDLSSGINIK